MWIQKNTNVNFLQCIEIHQLWKSQGRPGQGPIHLERMRVRADYRRALKAAQLAPKQAMWDNKILRKRIFGGKASKIYFHYVKLSHKAD